MPARKPIIPGFSGSRQLLRSLHSEMRDKKGPPDHSSSSSGIHSNSDVSDNSELARGTRRGILKNGKIRQNSMGKTTAFGDDYFYSDDKQEKENASSSSGPDDDDDDEDDSDNNDGARGDENEDCDDASNDSCSDGYDDEKEARENDDRIAWENHKRNTGTKPDFPNKYALQPFPAQGTVTTRVNDASNRRLSGPTSYVKLVKETEDEIELIRRKHNARLRQHQQGKHITQHGNKEIMAKRKSTNSITFLYGRRKEDSCVSNNGSQRHSVDVCAIKQERNRPVSLNPRAREIEEHIKRIQGGHITIRPLDAQRQANGVRNALAIHNSSTNNTEIGPPRPKPRSNAKRDDDSDDSSIEFPLKDIAAGHAENSIDIHRAKTLERIAKQKTKALKNDIGLAKLDVAEAKLGEFAATLRARQARIEERHAKLCRRRAALKKAEEEQDTLEAKMDEEEEDHRARERRIKNRERRVKQEEAGIRLKEESLRKREEKVKEGIDQIERRRKLVEEKEEVQKAMDEIMMRKEELHGRDIASEKAARAGILGKLIKKSGREKQYVSSSSKCSSSNDHSEDYHAAVTRKSSTGTTTSTSQNGARRPQNLETGGTRTTTTMDRPQANGKSANVYNANKPEGKPGVMGLWI